MIRPQDIARLYEIIVQNLNDITNLPGIQDDAQLEEEIQADIVAYKAFRYSQQLPCSSVIGRAQSVLFSIGRFVSLSLL